MFIEQSKNIISTKDTIKVVPISDCFDNIDKVKYILENYVLIDENAGKKLSIHNYFINDDQVSIVIGNNNVKSIKCPYRNKRRSIKC